MNEIELFYYRVISELEKIKSKRCYNERTIFDLHGKKMRRKLEKGFVSGVGSAINVLKRTKKEFDKYYASEQVEYKERTALQ